MAKRQPDIRYILALDSSMSGASAGIYDAVLGHSSVRRSDDPRGQAEMLVPLAQDCVKAAGIDFEDIDLIVTPCGPGSFTGLRIALSAAKSFALALEIPIVAPITTEVLMHQYAVSHDVSEYDYFLVLETKRTDYYVHLFDGSFEPKLKVQALEARDALRLVNPDRTILLGDAVQRFVEEAQIIFAGYCDIKQIDPVVLAQVGLAQYQNNNGAKDNPIEPLYLRGADVSEPKIPVRKMKL